MPWRFTAGPHSAGLVGQQRRRVLSVGAMGNTTVDCWSPATRFGRRCCCYARRRLRCGQNGGSPCPKRTAYSRTNRRSVADGGARQRGDRGWHVWRVAFFPVEPVPDVRVAAAEVALQRAGRRRPPRCSRRRERSGCDRFCSRSRRRRAGWTVGRQDDGSSGKLTVWSLAANLFRIPLVNLMMICRPWIMIGWIMKQDFEDR